MTEWPRIVGYQPSSDGKGEYEILETETGDLLCGCKGFKWRNKCRHVDRHRRENEVVLRFNVKFLDGRTVVAMIEGKEQQLESFKIGDVLQRVAETEAHLERLTGFRCRIEQVG